MAVTVNIYIDAGTDYTNIITVTDENSNELDITDYVIKSQMRKSVGSTTAYNIDANIYDAVNGQAILTLTATQSGAIPGGRYLYDVEITSPYGIKTRVIEGLAIVSPQITQT